MIELRSDRRGTTGLCRRCGWVRIRAPHDALVRHDDVRPPRAWRCVVLTGGCLRRQRRSRVRSDGGTVCFSLQAACRPKHGCPSGNIPGENMAPNDEAQYAPETHVRPPREQREKIQLPTIGARAGSEKKRAAAAARARAQPGEGPAVVWVETGLEEMRRFGKPLEKSPTDQVFATEVGTMHAGLQRAGVEVATFIEETGATSWATAQQHRVVCVCLQLASRDLLKDPDGLVRMLGRYTGRGIGVCVIQPTPPVPTAKDAKCVRVGKRICGENEVPLCLDTRSAMQCVMELVAKQYAFVDGRLQRAAAQPKQEEVSAPSPVGSAPSRRASPTRFRPTPPPADPQRNRVDPGPSLGIGIISDLEPEPEVAAIRRPRFMRPRPVQGGAAANAAAARSQFEFDQKRPTDPEITWWSRSRSSRPRP